MSTDPNTLLTFNITNETHMLALGRRFANACPEKALIFLQGNLGAGKTTWARGFLNGLGYSKLVKSPTYTLVEPYEMNEKKIFHFDFYRLRDPQELTYIGIEDYLATKAICLIEWPEQVKALLPTPDVTLSIHIVGSARKVKTTVESELGHAILQGIPPT